MNHRWSDLGPIIGGAAALFGGAVLGHWSMPESNLAPIVGLIICPVGAVVGWVLGMIADYLINRKSG